MMSQPFLFKDVLHLLHLVIKLSPFLRIIGNEGALSRFLGDNDKGTDFGIGPALVIAEVALRQELHTRSNVMMESLSAKNILFL